MLAACGGSGRDAGDDGRVHVVAAFYPLAFAAETIGGASVRVENLTPPGVEPHDFELSARDAEVIAQADLVVYLGGGFQPALERAARASSRTVDLLEGLDLREDGDPHVWLDPVRYAAIAERLGRELGADAQGAALAERLHALDAEIRDGLARCDRRAIVTSHEAFGYLVERYGLEQVPITGIAPESEPAPKNLARVVDAVRASGATTVFGEPLVSRDLAEAVARETGIAVATLDPIEGLTEEQLAAGADYFSVMRDNLAAVRTGLGCR